MIVGDEKLDPRARPAFRPEDIAAAFCNPGVFWREGWIFFTFFGRNPLKSPDSKN